MDKTTLRNKQFIIRKTVLAHADTVFYTPLWENIQKIIDDYPTDYTVAGYYPIKNEIDVLPVLHGLQNPTALPCTITKHVPLTFKLWRQGDMLTTDIYNIPCPTQTAETVIPDILLVPLLAFDNQGYRLGYGGGFYDRTIAKYTPPVTIGIGAECLYTKFVPTDKNDKKMTHIVTEKRTLLVP